MIEGNSSKGFERILKLFTIFLIVGIFSLNLIYSSDFNFKPITKINPLKQPIFDNKQVNYTPKITIKDLEKYTLFERVQMEKIGKLLDSSLYFKTSSLSIDVNEDCYLDVNLEKYIKNLNNLNYDLKLVSKDVDVNNCGFENKNLQCSFNSNFNGDVNIIVGLNNIFSDDDELLIKVKVLPVNDDPVLNEDFETLGQTTLSNETFTIDLAEYFYDEDDDELTYGVDISGDEDFDLVCNQDGSIFTCNSTGKGYKDLRFYAFDGYEKTYLSTYGIAVIDSGDIFGHSGSDDGTYTILENINFNLKFSLQNNLGYEIYNLPVSIESEDLDVSQYYNLNFDIGEEKAIETTLIIPEVNTTENYNVKLNIENAEKINDTLEIIDSADLGNYVSVEKIAPAKDTEVPHSVILAVPFNVINNLDSNVSLYYCGEATIWEDVVFLYNSNLEKTSNNFFCEQKTLEPGNNTLELYGMVSMRNSGSSPAMDLTVYLSNNILERDSIDYIDEDNIFYRVNDYENYDIKGAAINPTESSLNLNTNYDATFKFWNRSSFDIIDLNVCAKTYYKEEGSDYILGLENDYYKILSNPNCFTIDRLASSPVSSEEVIYSYIDFEFKTQNNIIEDIFESPLKGITFIQTFNNEYEHMISQARLTKIIN